MPMNMNTPWLLHGARECSMISTIVKPPSASNVFQRWAGRLLDYVLTLSDPFRSGLASEEASELGGRQLVFTVFVATVYSNIAALR